MYAAKSTLVSKLRDYKPDHLMVHHEDEQDPTRVNVPNVRNRAQKVLRTLGEVAWVKVEFFDKKNGLLGQHIRGVEDEQPAGELETLASSREMARDTAQLNLMLRAQDMALSRHASLVQPLLDAVYKLVDFSMKRLDLMDRQYEHALKVNGRMSDDLARSALKLQAAVVNANEVGDEDEEGIAGGMVSSMLPAFIRAAMEKPDADERPRRKPAKRAKAKPATEERQEPKQSSPNGHSTS